MTSKLKYHKNYTELGELYQMMWKQEVQLELREIYDRTSGQFIWDILVLTKQGFNSWKDEKSFNELQGGLRALFIL